ncbi:hypothetical protein FGO68_gene4524 [Halteria grandinella]|uniref:Prohibitin n=1 Tax=Halteria grandinella TaxID=5974 RepID=A0A8J8NIA0_HALGN|nr:hypothetical protein FGO68_gene4524 [Halteria grandinella]
MSGSSQSLQRLATLTFVSASSYILYRQCLFTVDAGHRVILFNKFKGIEPNIYAEGIHFKTPFITKVIDFDVRTQVFTQKHEIVSTDQVEVDIKYRILYRPNVDKLPQLYMALGTQYAQMVIPALVTEISSEMVLGLEARSLLVDRKDIGKKFQEKLTQRAETFHIVIDDLAIVDLVFDDEYVKKLEDRQALVAKHLKK